MVQNHLDWLSKCLLSSHQIIASDFLHVQYLDDVRRWGCVAPHRSSPLHSESYVPLLHSLWYVNCEGRFHLVSMTFVCAMGNIMLSWSMDNNLACHLDPDTSASARGSLRVAFQSSILLESVRRMLFLLRKFCFLLCGLMSFTYVYVVHPSRCWEGCFTDCFGMC